MIFQWARLIDIFYNCFEVPLFEGHVFSFGLKLSYNDFVLYENNIKIKQGNSTPKCP